MNKHRLNRAIRKTVVTILGYLLLVVLIFPFVWIVLASLQPESEIIRLPPFPARPTTFTLDNFRYVLGYRPFTNSIFTSIVVAIVTTAFVMSAGAVGAYALAKLRFPGREAIFTGIMVVYMLPGMAMLIPMVIVMKHLGLLDSIAGLIMAHTIYILPMMTWFLVGIFEGVPADLEEAAQVDGYSKLGTLTRVVIPLSISGFFLITVFCFVLSWNELMFAKVVGIFKVKMLQPAIFEFLSPTALQYSQVAAASLISGMPVVLLAIVLQKYIIAGILKGAVK
jgi:multiple sugar transport system permease protein